MLSSLTLLFCSVTALIQVQSTEVGPCSSGMPMQAWSDIDDTFIFGGDRFGIAGYDRRGPLKTTYPGAAALLVAISIGSGDNALGDRVGNRPIFLSARPLRFLVHRLHHEEQIPATAGAFSSVIRFFEPPPAPHPVPWLQTNVTKRGTVLGDLLSTLGRRRKRHIAYGLTKFRRIQSWMTNNSKIFSSWVPGSIEDTLPVPDKVCSVFVGDDGQGDVVAGAHMLRNFSGNFKAVLIHKVASENGHAPLLDRADLDHRDHSDADLHLVRNATDRLLFFHTYAEAARLALDHDLISSDAAVLVAAAIVTHPLVSNASQKTFAALTMRQNLTAAPAGMLDLSRDHLASLAKRKKPRNVCQDTHPAQCSDQNIEQEEEQEEEVERACVVSDVVELVETVARRVSSRPGHHGSRTLEAVTRTQGGDAFEAIRVIMQQFRTTWQETQQVVGDVIEDDGCVAENSEDEAGAS